jgi:hypothetical protein
LWGAPGVVRHIEVFGRRNIMVYSPRERKNNMNDPLQEAESHLFSTQLDRRRLEPESIALMAKLFQMPPEKLYRLLAEGPTLEEQRIQEEQMRVLEKFRFR